MYNATKKEMIEMVHIDFLGMLKIQSWIIKGREAN
jgi:hypothetical protein